MMINKFFMFCISTVIFILMTGNAIEAEDSYCLGKTTITESRGGVVHCNEISGICHNQTCRWFNCAHCVIVFNSTEEAEKQGYRACKKCGG